ncbi:DUF6157 family protein [Streptomyces mayteni]
MDVNYLDTLIAVADDCPVEVATVPATRGAKPTVATIQYELIAGAPGELTQEDVIFETWLSRQDRPRPAAAERAALRAGLFARPQACLRSSPLPKRFGWGLLCDGEGRVTLCPMESDTYRRVMAGEVPGVTVRRALRSRRA